ncbi:MAG: DNA alkylation repair protein [Candidatus Micrarchaeota archaeon]
METKTIAKWIAIRLEKKANLKRAAGSFAYFKEKINPRGVTVPKVREIEKELWNLHQKEFSLDFCLDLTEELFQSGYWEDPVVGMGLVRRFENEFDETTFKRFENWVKKYVSNWAHCDDLCNHLVGSVLENQPELAKQVVGWAKSENRWVRRAAAVSFILPARKGLFEREILEIAERLFSDKTDDLVQKGNGWMLREYGKTQPKKLLAFLKKHRENIPRVTMRYALEKFSAKEKKGL